ncbi:prolipoprotein diacylglyceryl transferase [Litoribacillus peritrichatus]|uniref:Phosphatidylglycerol--prolipoprotein diacylglyceryl transferase n=1 Tax=Litoribacillus peritrichatus TaxID=718191 RepID=A0ABP7NFQ0_9GAMM
MIAYPSIDPVALELGPLKVHWYGIMYLVGFAGAYWLLNLRAKKSGSWTSEQVSDLVFWGAMGVILGGRIGYVLFYNFSHFLSDPLSLFYIWEGGMSFHGGLIGVMSSLYIYGRRINKTFFEMMDFVAPVVPVGLGAGRIGNFIGGELWGRVSDVPWAMVFPRGGDLPRHPSQLYQFALEGVALFVILWWFSAKPRPRMAVSGLFLAFYGLFRFIVEFARQPDEHLGFIYGGWLTMGQLLSTPMILLGVAVVWFAYHSESSIQNKSTSR